MGENAKIRLFKFFELNILSGRAFYVLSENLKNIVFGWLKQKLWPVKDTFAITKIVLQSYMQYDISTTLRKDNMVIYYSEG